jgi:predicted ester cyclase
MPDEHRDLARRFIAVFDSGDTATLDEIVADDVTDHNPLPGTGTGRQGIADAVAIYRGAFPDLAVTVDRLVAEDDRKAGHLRLHRHVPNRRRADRRVLAPRGRRRHARTARAPAAVGAARS